MWHYAAHVAPRVLSESCPPPPRTAEGPYSPPYHTHHRTHHHTYHGHHHSSSHLSPSPSHSPHSLAHGDRGAIYYACTCGTTWPPPPLHVPPQVHARRLACSQQVVLTVRCPLWVYNCTGMPLAIRPAVSVTDYDDGGAGGTSYGLVAGTWLPSCVGVQGSMPYSLASPRSSHTAALQVGHRGTHLLAGNQTYACRWGGRGLRGIHLRAGHQTYRCKWGGAGIGVYTCTRGTKHMRASRGAWA